MFSGSPAFCPASSATFKIHVRHIEGFQFVVELLGLRQRGACAVQVKLNPARPCSSAHSWRSSAPLRETGGKIEALFGGKLFAGGDERGERGDGQVQQPPWNEGAQVLLDAVTGGLNGGAQSTQDGRAIHALMEQQADHARRAFSPMRLISSPWA